MKKNVTITVLAIMVILLLSLSIYNVYYSQKECYRPQLSVIGDVSKTINIKDYAGLDTVNINYKNQDIEVIKLKDLLNKSVPVTDNFSVLFTATDGMQALIPGDNLEKCYLNFSADYGWQAININHPVSSNVKYMDEIIVISRNKNIENRFALISGDNNLVEKTVGQLLAGEYYQHPHYEGSSSLDNNGQIYKDSVFTVKKVMKIEDIIDREINQSSFVIAEKGVSRFYRGGMFILKENRVDYLDPERKINLKNCQGMIINPPMGRNSDTYHDTLHYIDKGQKVLIVLLDGFGFHQYQYAIANNYAPFLAEFKEARKAVSVYKPVTNAGLAATLTGTGPEGNGVYSHDQNELITSDIFTGVSERGGESIYIEGNINILNTSIKPDLNPDLNNNGSTDDEVFAAARKNLNKDYDLVYVHFHGIDDCGHNYGDISKETMKKIRETDSYLRQLVNMWSGKVIITADHGMHSTTTGGDHGQVRYEDLIVPYILAEGRK